MQPSAQLSCPKCSWTTVCGPVQMLKWLRGVKMVRSDAAPDPELMGEVFRAAAAKFSCPECGNAGLSVGEADDGGDDEAWGMPRKCEDCGRPIGQERLEVFPETRLCVICQAKDDRGDVAGAAEYCPKCGSLMTLVQRQRGVTRYVMTCRNCGK